MIATARIIDVKSENTALVKITDPGGDRFWIPFQGKEIASVFVLDANHVLAVSASLHKNNQIALYDFEQEKTSKETAFDGINIRYCFLNKSKHQLYIFGYNSLTMVQVPSLENSKLVTSVQVDENLGLPIHPQAFSIHQQRIFVNVREPVTERTDGTLLMGWERETRDISCAGALSFDPHSGTFRAKLLSTDHKSGLDDTALWFSPDGNYCLRRPRLSHIGSQKAHGDEGEFTELWDISEVPRLVRKIQHPQEGRAEAAVWDDASRNLWLLLTGHIVLRVDVSGKISYEPTIIGRWADKKNPFKVLENFETRMPVKAEYSKKAIFLEGQGRARVDLSLVGCVTVPVGSEKKRGFLSQPRVITSESDEYCPVEDDEDKAAKKYVRSLSIVNISLADESDAAICDALNSLANQIETGLEQLVWQGKIEIAYQCKRRKISQETLLDSAVEQNRVAVAPALAHLLDMYLENDPPYGLRQNSSRGSMPAFFLELRALMLLDPARTDLLRRYFLSVSSEHGRYVQAELIPEIYEKLHLSRAATTALEVFFLLHYVLDGDITDFGSSIIEKARDAFDAPILSNMIVQEIRWFEPKRYARFVSEFGKVMSGHNDYNAEFMAGLERGLAKEV